MESDKNHDVRDSDGPSPKDPKAPMDRSGPFIAAALAICLGLAGATFLWIRANDREVEARYDAEIRFSAAPESARPGQVVRFEAEVVDPDGDKPLAGRVVDITLGPGPEAEIVSVTGAGGGRQGSALANHVLGRTDAGGKVEVLLRVPEAGEYTLVAADTASKEGATVNFRVGAPSG